MIKTSTRTPQHFKYNFEHVGLTLFPLGKMLTLVSNLIVEPNQRTFEPVWSQKEDQVHMEIVTGNHPFPVGPRHPNRRQS